MRFGEGKLRLKRLCSSTVTINEASQPGFLLTISVPDPTAAPLFRGRAPQRLAFGTSGLRGLVTDITDLEAYINARGFLDELVARGALKARTPVALAGDLRPSSESPDRSISRAVAEAVRDAGFRVVYDGRIPTPALAAHGFREGWPSIMVTGSHIPFDRNGIKFNRADGEVLKSDEARIVAAVERARRTIYAEPTTTSAFDDQGMFRRPAAPLPPADPEAHRRYVDRYLSFFPPQALAGTKVVVFEHTAVGRDILAEILRGLGAEVFPTGRTETFVAIDTEAIPDDRLAEMQALAREATAKFGPFDALVSTDGDSDRPMVFGAATDGTLTFIGGDSLGILVADYLDADAVAIPVTATDAIERHFAERPVRLIRTKVGSPFVIEGIAPLPGHRKVGWEANGGFLTFSAIAREGRTLAPLPTRDAILPITAVLHAARLRRCRVGELLAALPPRFARAGLLDHVPVSQGRALAARTDTRQKDLRTVTFPIAGSSVAARWTDFAGREQEATGALASRLAEIHAAISADFSSDFDQGRGFGALLHLDYLDGLRMTFAGGDVAHVRSSGNAPQLRIYALASSDERARAIVDMTLAPGGIFSAMLARL